MSAFDAGEGFHDRQLKGASSGAVTQGRQGIYFT